MSVFQVEQLALALTEIAKHAADMQLSEELHHDACPYCETAVLVSRVARFGAQLRAVELQEIHQ